MADYDGLTNAYNRRSGLEKLGVDVKSGKAVTIIYIDIDKFKYINDNYGHSTGDKALKMFCIKINELIPEESYLIRLGGDEFLCVLLNKSEIAAKEFIATFMKSPVIYGNNPKDKLFFSYGIATFDQGRHENVDEFIHDADKQMYTFKNSG